jgi:hypothetical protein
VQPCSWRRNAVSIAVGSPLSLKEPAGFFIGNLIGDINGILVCD